MEYSEKSQNIPLEKLLVNLYNYARDYLNFETDVQGVDFIDKEVEETKKWSLGVVLGSTGYYDPKRKVIGLYTTNRGIKDILRSFAHELIHHAQFERETLTDEDMFSASPGYARKPGKLRDAEMEAFQMGNMMFRDWEDELKEKASDMMLNENKNPWQKPVKYKRGGRVASNLDLDLDELTKEQLNFDVLDACREQAAHGFNDSELMGKLDQMFHIVVGEAFEEMGFNQGHSMPADTYEFENSDMVVTFKLFGPNGPISDANQYGDEVNNNVILTLTWDEDEGNRPQKGIYEKEYATIKEAMRHFLKALEKSTTIKMER